MYPGITRRKFLSCLPAPFLAHTPALAFAEGAKTTLSLTDLGFRPGTVDAEPAFRAAIERLPQAGGTIVVPPGLWRFRRTEGAAITLAGRDNVTIEGAGATLLFAGVARPFTFENCVAPTVRGLTIDWERPPFSQGEVIAVGGGGRSADIRVEHAFPVDGSEPIAAFQTMEPGTLLMARHGLDVYGAIEKTELIAAQTLRITFTRFIPLNVGDVVVLRHKLYEAHALSFTRCKNLVVEDVTLHSAPGMGVAAGGCDGGSVRRLAITPPPNSSRMMTLTADGVHFGSCRGEIVIEDCLMRGMGDDCVNVHGKFYVIEQVVDRRTLRVAAPPGTRFGALAPSPRGDVFELASQDYGSLGQTVLLDARNGKTDMILSFDRDLPGDLEAGELVRDVETDTKTRITGCKFPGNRARGVLAHADTLIERCAFSGQSMSAVLLSVEPYFLEGPVISNVNVVANHIENVSRSTNFGAITIDAIVKGIANASGTGPERVDHDLSIRKNTFTNCTSPAITVSCLDTALIEENLIGCSHAFALSFENCTKVRIEKNIFSQNGDVLLVRVARGDVQFSANIGLSDK